MVGMGMISCVGMGVSVETGVDVVHETNNRTTRSNSLLMMGLYSFCQNGHDRDPFFCITNVLLTFGMTSCWQM